MEVITSGWNCGPGKSPFLPRFLCSHPVYHWMDLGSIWGPFCFAVWPGGPPLPLCAAPCNALSMGPCAATHLMPEHRCCLFNLRVPSHLMLLCLPAFKVSVHMRLSVNVCGWNGPKLNHIVSSDVYIYWTGTEREQIMAAAPACSSAFFSVRKSAVLIIFFLNTELEKHRIWAHPFQWHPNISQDRVIHDKDLTAAQINEKNNNMW